MEYARWRRRPMIDEYDELGLPDITGRGYLSGRPNAPWAAYAVAMAFAGACVVLMRWIVPGAQGGYALSFALVALAAWRWGRGPSLASLAIVALGGLLSSPAVQPNAALATPLIIASLAFVALLVSWLVSVHLHEALHLAQLAFYDPLTTLPNRALFMDRLTQASARSVRNGHLVALLYLDFDDFKLVNDQLGHAAGDALLASAGDRLRNLVRASDTVARLGGDEFAVLLEDVDNTSSARLVAQRLIDVLHYPTIFQGETLQCSPSVGIAYATSGSPSPNELLRLADAALYQAKRSNKGWFCEAAELPAGVKIRPPNPASRGG